MTYNVFGGTLNIAQLNSTRILLNFHQNVSLEIYWKSDLLIW